MSDRKKLMMLSSIAAVQRARAGEALLLAVMRAETRYHGPLARAAHRALHRLAAADAAD